MSNKVNSKSITVEYYYVCSLEDDPTKKNTSVSTKRDISPLLEELKKASVQERTVNYFGESIILSSVEYNESSKIWELVFYKSRNSTAPIIVDAEGCSREIILNNGEMLSEVLCVEYNADLKIFAIQRNIYAFGTRGIETFFSSFITYPLHLESIQTLTGQRKNLLKKAPLKKFKMRVRRAKGGPNGTFYNKGTTICNAIDSALAVDSAIINIEFSMGNSSKTINVEDEDFDVFDDLINNNNVKCLELGYVPDERATMEITDFMNLRVRDIISVPFIKGQPLDVVKILDKMTKKFQENIYLK